MSNQQGIFNTSFFCRIYFYKTLKIYFFLRNIIYRAYSYEKISKVRPQNFIFSHFYNRCFHLKAILENFSWNYKHEFCDFIYKMKKDNKYV